MKTIKFNQVVAILFMTFLIFSCKKDKYQPIGDYGNANTTSSNTLTLNNWQTIYDDGTNYAFKSINGWGEITQDILDNGIVMVYIKDGNQWTALPYGEDEDTYSTNINFSFEVGTLNIFAEGWRSPISPNPSDFNGVVIRAVIVSQEGRMANPNVNYSNYKEVKRVFNLRD